MPELPEVETVRRGMLPHLRGRRLRSAEFAREDLRWPMPTAELRGLAGHRCTDIKRRSKYLLLGFDDPGRSIGIIHLGMSGRLFVDVLGQRAKRPDWERHEHWRLDFGSRLARYVDPRRFGIFDLTDAHHATSHPLLGKLGPEPLSDAFDAAYLFEITRRRKAAIKTFLMDAKNVVGVGNIYASEACFRARVRPTHAAGRMRRTDCEHLVAAVRAVLEAAIAAGGTTLRDYIGVDQATGYFQRELFVYGRENEPCSACATPIRRTVQQNRATYYCPRCQ